jgi:hypothetical protein
MKKLGNLGSALTIAAIMATGMFTSSARLHAAGPGTGGGRSNTVICTGLKVLYDGATAAGATDQAASVFAYAQSIGCEWAQ